MAAIDVDDEVYRTIDRATRGREMNQGLRELLGLAPTGTLDKQKTAGDLAGLISARLITPGDHLIATAPIRTPEPVATVTDNACLRANDATVYPGPGPATFIAHVRGGTFAPYGWQLLTTTDGRNLATCASNCSHNAPRTSCPLDPAP